MENNDRAWRWSWIIGALVTFGVVGWWYFHSGGPFGWGWYALVAFITAWLAIFVVFVIHAVVCFVGDLLDELRHQ